MNDPVLDEIRRVRHAMSAQIEHDPRRIPELFASLRTRIADRIVSHGANDEGRTTDCAGDADNAFAEGASSAVAR